MLLNNPETKSRELFKFLIVMSCQMVWAIADAKLVSWGKGNMGIFVSDITQLHSILLVAKE